MPKEDFQVKGPLGKGSFGCVFKVVRKSDHEVYALKQMKLQKLKDKDKQNALTEIRILASIEHPYIISYKEAFYDTPTQTLNVVMEYANEGDLDGKVKKHQKHGSKFPEKEIWKLAYQALEGLNKLHETNIIHRDIKAANIFFHNGDVKIGDLNVAKHLKDQFAVTQTGTPYYASPEVWNEQPYDYKSDIWSLGCVLYEMTMLKHPFRADNAEALFQRIQSGVYDRISSIYTKSLSEFIGKFLTVAQKKRPTTKDFLAMPVMMELKDNITLLDDCEEDPLMGTIQFPPNLKALNSNLPAPKYDSDAKKSVKYIDIDGGKVKSTKNIGLPSMKNIRSEKNIALLNAASSKSIKNEEKTEAQKPKSSNKIASKKLIF